VDCGAAAEVAGAEGVHVYQTARAGVVLPLAGESANWIEASQEGQCFNAGDTSGEPGSFGTCLVLMCSPVITVLFAEPIAILVIVYARAVMAALGMFLALSA
jgi:hypothetical protein